MNFADQLVSHIAVKSELRNKIDKYRFGIHYKNKQSENIVVNYISSPSGNCQIAAISNAHVLPLLGKSFNPDILRIGGKHLVLTLFKKEYANELKLRPEDIRFQKPVIVDGEEFGLILLHNKSPETLLDLQNPNNWKDMPSNKGGTISLFDDLISFKFDYYKNTPNFALKDVSNLIPIHNSIKLEALTVNINNIKHTTSLSASINMFTEYFLSKKIGIYKTAAAGQLHLYQQMKASDGFSFVRQQINNRFNFSSSTGSDLSLQFFSIIIYITIAALLSKQKTFLLDIRRDSTFHAGLLKMMELGIFKESLIPIGPYDSTSGNGLSFWQITNYDHFQQYGKVITEAEAGATPDARV